VNLQDNQTAGQVPFAVHLPSYEYTVAPGQGLTIPLVIHNQGSGDQALNITIRGVPGPWVSLPSPFIRLAPGEQREMNLTIQPPAYPQGRAGRHDLVIRVANQQVPSEAVEKSCNLTVAAYHAPGRIDLLLPATEFSVAPGGSMTIPLVLTNQGLDSDTFLLSVEGIPSSWVYAPAAAIPLSPGQQREASINVQPPVSAEARAGRHAFKIQVASQAAPGQMAEAACVLTIAAATRFGAELHPPRVEAGQPARLAVENKGNVQQAFTLSWHSPGDELAFEPEGAQELPVAPGEVGMAEFRASPRRRPFFGGAFSLPFTARVQAPDRQVQNVTGEVVSRALVPSWVLPAVLVVVLGIVLTLVLVAVLGNGGPEGAPTQLPEVEQPPAATEAPPPEEPTQPPPEDPTEPPPEEPTEPPPEQPTEEPAEPTAEQPPEGEGPPEGGEPSGPCASLGFGLALVPLALLARRRT
jgi:hypothetical protein